MCTAALYQELDRYIFEDYDSPMDMYHKTHSFPSDVFLNAKNELEIALEKALEDYLPVPSNIVKKIEIRAYLELREHLFLNFSRTLLTRQWIVIAGSKTKGRYKPSKCHIMKSYARTRNLLKHLLNERLITKEDGGLDSRGNEVANRYFPTQEFAKALIKFSPFVEEHIRPPFIKIKDSRGYDKFHWEDDHPDLAPLIEINEYANNQSWTLKNPIIRTFKYTPFHSGRLINRFQNLPKKSFKIRNNTLINKNPIAEVDFNANHLRLLAAYQKQPLNCKDPYLEIVDEDNSLTRDDVKNFINIAINCKSYRGTILAIEKDEKVDIPIEICSKIYDAFKKRYSNLDLYPKFKYKGLKDKETTFSLYAMNYEGDILTKALFKGIKEDIFMLPIHDAIAVQQHHKERANEIMLETWSEVVSEMCGQKVDTVTKFE